MHSYRFSTFSISTKDPFCVQVLIKAFYRTQFQAGGQLHTLRAGFKKERFQVFNSAMYTELTVTIHKL